MIEDILSNQAFYEVIVFLSGVLLTGLVWGAAKLKSSFEKSSNKYDDLLIPILDALGSLDKKQDEQTKKLDDLGNG